MFPSPYGDMVLKSVAADAFKTLTVTFPSPCGDMVLKYTVDTELREKGI